MGVYFSKTPHCVTVSPPPFSFFFLGVVGTVCDTSVEFKSDGHKNSKLPYCVTVSFGDALDALERCVVVCVFIYLCIYIYINVCIRVYLY